MPYSLEQRRAFQQIMLHVRASSARVLGFTSAEHSAGVTSFAEGVAATAASVGLRTLLISNHFPPQSDDRHDGRTDMAFLSNNLGVCAGDPRNLGEVGPARSFLDQHRSAYEAIVFDLPPVLEVSELNPFAVGSVCDVIFLVCRLGHTSTQRLARAAQAIRRNNGNLVGVVANSYGYETPGQQIAKVAHRLGAVAPGVANWISSRALESDLTNS